MTRPTTPNTVRNLADRMEALTQETGYGSSRRVSNAGHLAEWLRRQPEAHDIAETADRVTVPAPTFGTETTRAAQHLVDAAWKLRNGYSPGGSTVTSAIARLCDDVAHALDPDARTTYSGTYPAARGAVDATIYIHDLTAEDRRALPPQYHRPYFDDLGQPNSWICVVCYDADAATTTQWPCQPAITGGRDVARACGLEHSQ